MPNCPVCGSKLEEARRLSPDIFGVEDNPIIGYVCRNDDCKGWFCEVCKTWHPFGTSCAVAMVREVRDNRNYKTWDMRGIELYNQIKEGGIE